VPLMIEMKSGDKLIINGAAIENSGPNTKLLIHNKSAILREKEVMSEKDSVTPASRVYFALQCAYIFPEKRTHYLRIFDQFLREYAEASPSSAPIVEKITEAVREDRLYQGLKAAQKLLKHEEDLMKLAGKDLRKPEAPANDTAEEASG